MEWQKVNAETVKAHMAVELATAYDKWILAYPQKVGRLEEITNNIRAEFRDVIASVPKNSLDPDPETLPDSVVRHAENIIQYEMGMEVGVKLTADGRRLLTEAEIYRRQIAYGHYLFTDENNPPAATPSYVVPSKSSGRALGDLVALLLGFFLSLLPVRAAWIQESNETTYIPVNYDITEQSLGGHLAGIDNALGFLSDTNSMYGRLAALPAQVAYMQSLLNEFDGLYARKELGFPVDPNWNPDESPGEDPGEENAYTLSEKGLRANDLRVDGYFYDNFEWTEAHGWTYTTNPAGIELHGQRITNWSNLAAYIPMESDDYIRKASGDEVGTIVVGHSALSPYMFNFDRPMGSLEILGHLTLDGTKWTSFPDTNAIFNALAESKQADEDFREEIDELEGWTSGVAWLTPARFTWEAERQLEPTEDYGPVMDWNYSVLYRAHVMSQLESWHLTPNIQRNTYNDDFEVDVIGDLDPPMELPDGSYNISWIEPGPPGQQATVVGVLRDWFQEITIERGEVTTVTQQTFYAFAEDGLREAYGNVRSFWEMAPGDKNRFLDYGHSKTATVQTLELTPNPDFWPATVFPPNGADLSGVSVWNDTGGSYYTKPVTLISSNVAMSAAHWSPPVGTTVAFYGKDGTLAFSRIIAQTKCGFDMAFSRLSPPLDTANVTAYPILDSRTFYEHIKLPLDVADVPMVPLLACAQACTAWLMGNVDFTMIGTSASLTVRPIVDGEDISPHGRKGAVGGDSGHPVFVTHNGQDLVLVGCYWTANTISYPGAARDIVEPAIAGLVGTNAVRFETYPDWPTYTGIPD